MDLRIKNWGTFAFITGYHALLLALLPAYFDDFSWASFWLFLVTWCLSGFAITAGYHRLFSHNAYKAHPIYEWACLIASSLSVQASALQWSHDHRMHHSYVDTDKDPYNIHRGFWYAHVWWLFVNPRSLDERLVKDLLKNPRVMFQHRHYLALTILVNLGVFGIGCLFMSPLAAFTAGVLLRVFAIHHCTWFINSLCHVWGARTYSKELTAVDNAILSFLTFGEGYHNYHHTIANDYRNGIRWYHFDPTKWIIWTSSKIGLTSNLHWLSDMKLHQHLVKKDKTLLLDRIKHEIDETSREFHAKLEALSERFDAQTATLAKKLNEMGKATEENQRLLRLEIKELQKDLRSLWNSWVSLTDFMSSHYRLEHSYQ